MPPVTAGRAAAELLLDAGVAVVRATNPELAGAIAALRGPILEALASILTPCLVVDAETATVRVVEGPPPT